MAPIDAPNTLTASAPTADSSESSSAAAETLPLPAWQKAVRDAVRDPAELARLLELGPDALPTSPQPAFPLLVPRGFVARMRRGDPADPLLRQVWPLREELDGVPGFTRDPVREHSLAADGVIRRYPGRALLVASATCPVHCRYCFRRDFPYPSQLAARGDWEAAVAALSGTARDAREVILSGGDPLSLSNRRLGEIFAKLADTAVATVRVHTRFPIVVPERIDAGLLEIIGRSPQRVVVVVHCNHANEIDASVHERLLRLRPRVAALLNQSVLLRGVNDEPRALAALSERLFDSGVLPYYLHLLDRVAGAAHFDVSESTAVGIVAELRARLPGYLVPRLVRETPGELSKTPVA